ncbi:hypothetical protein JN11_04592 [Mucilaginibacter frigoritolerans]|jgi:hypothetical protein|uniref:Uncharacterized protein n=1 Tax=Mucilaginibacter frigoritolerans TaxID=652788 RepID=A0A562TMK0_9SPHI|nr:hypothetical protein JN11_04592 [Mucilaginibacter frigoritolerans]
MLKRLTIWFLIFAIFIANFAMVFVYMGFKLNQQYIAQNLCINRFKPSIHCNGHCYFMRKIRQAEENEKKQSTKGNSGRVEISFFQEPFSISFIEPIISDKAATSFRFFVYRYISQYLNSIFRPPKSLV